MWVYGGFLYLSALVLIGLGIFGGVEEVISGVGLVSAWRIRGFR